MSRSQWEQMLFNGDVPAIRAYARESGRVSYSPCEVQGCLLKKKGAQNVHHFTSSQWSRKLVLIAGAEMSKFSSISL